MSSSSSFQTAATASSPGRSSAAPGGSARGGETTAGGHVRRQRAKAAAKAAAQAAAHAALEWTEEEASGAALAVGQEAVPKELSPPVDQQPESSSAAASPRQGDDTIASQPSAAPKASVALPRGSRKKGRRRREPTKTLAFTFSTEVRRGSRRRTSDQESAQERLGGGAVSRPRASSGGLSSRAESGLATTAGAQKPKSGGQILLAGLLGGAAANQGGLDDSMIELPEDSTGNFAAGDSDWLEKESLSPSAVLSTGLAAPASFRATKAAVGVAQRRPSFGSTMTQAPASPPGGHCGAASSPCFGAASSMQRGRPGLERPRLTSKPGEQREEQLPGGGSMSRSASSSSACAALDDGEFAAAAYGALFTERASILRARIGSHLLRPTEAERPASRHVCWNQDAPVEVVQFCVEQPMPNTTRGPRRVFGGELQAQMMASGPSPSTVPGASMMAPAGALGTGPGRPPRGGLPQERLVANKAPSSMSTALPASRVSEHVQNRRPGISDLAPAPEGMLAKDPEERWQADRMPTW